MSGWFPVSGCTLDCVATPLAGLGRIGRAARWGGLVRALASGQRDGAGALRALRALGVTVQLLPVGETRRAGGVGSLVVANHVSWLDDVALLALLPGVRPVAKAEMADWPVVGRTARRNGTVFLDRARLSRLPGVVAEVAALLRAGHDVLVHPEGTTGCGAELHRFRPALFQAAIDAGAPVRPLALRYRLADGTGTSVAGYVGADSLWHSLGRVVATAGLVLEVHDLPLLSPGTDRRELAALAEYAIAQVTEAAAPTVGAHLVAGRALDRHRERRLRSAAAWMGARQVDPAA